MLSGAQGKGRQLARQCHRSLQATCRSQEPFITHFAVAQPLQSTWECFKTRAEPLLLLCKRGKEETALAAKAFGPREPAPEAQRGAPARFVL